MTIILLCFIAISSTFAGPSPHEFLEKVSKYGIDELETVKVEHYNSAIKKLLAINPKWGYYELLGEFVSEIKLMPSKIQISTYNVEERPLKKIEVSIFIGPLMDDSVSASRYEIEMQKTKSGWVFKSYQKGHLCSRGVKGKKLFTTRPCS